MASVSKLEIPVTVAVGGTLGLMFTGLTAAVIKMRKNNNVGFGTGEIPMLEQTIRAHANFVETSPLFLLLLLLSETSPTNALSKKALMGFGGAFVLGRLIHASGFMGFDAKKQPKQHYNLRVAGMALSLASILGVSGTLLHGAFKAAQATTRQ
jgi:uncharacterized membrane protein YecN with MAPEG domain